MLVEECIEEEFIRKKIRRQDPIVRHANGKIKRAIRMLLLSLMLSYLLLLFISLLIATCLGEYAIITHTISKLGASGATPIPLLFDCACIIAGIIAIPNNFYYARFAHSKSSPRRNKLSRSLLSCGLAIGFIGGLSYFFVGVFSLERAGPNGVFHNSFAGSAFFGFVFSIFLFNLQNLLCKIDVSKTFGMIGTTMPLLVFFINCIISFPIFEWILLFTIIMHAVPLDYLALTR